MKMIMLDGYTLNPGDLSWDDFKKVGDFTVYDRTGSDTALIIERIGGAEAVLTNKTPITREVFDACPALKYVGVVSADCDAVDLNAAAEKGVTVTNIPRHGLAVSQTAIALLLEACHRISHHNKAVHDGRWATAIDVCFWDYPLIELYEKTLGVIGFGHAGQATGKIAKAMSMNVLALDEHSDDAGGKIAEYVPLDVLFAKSDVIVLHCPLSQSTRGIINKDNIAKMKDGVIIINNAHGQLVIEQDLCDALHSGKVYAAGLDVVSSEPIAPDNPLLKAPNCFITPHISDACIENRKRVMDTALENIKAYQSKAPVNIVKI